MRKATLVIPVAGWTGDFGFLDGVPVITDLPPPSDFSFREVIWRSAGLDWVASGFAAGA